MIDEDHLHRALRGLKLDAELLLERCVDGWAVRVSGVFGSELQLEIIPAFQMGAVDNLATYRPGEGKRQTRHRNHQGFHPPRRSLNEVVGRTRRPGGGLDLRPTLRGY